MTVTTDVNDATLTSAGWVVLACVAIVAVGYLIGVAWAAFYNARVDRFDARDNKRMGLR